MKGLTNTQKYNLEDLYVGEVYEVKVFGLDKNGQMDGTYKGNAKDAKVVVVKDANGDFYSVEKNEFFSSYKSENIIKNAKEKGALNVLHNVQQFSVAAEKYAKRKLPKKISKKAILKYQEIVQNEKENVTNL